MSRMPRELLVEVRSNVRRGAPSNLRISRWARAAAGARGRNAELALRIVGAAEGRRLNLLWRGRDYATNVLSFPAPAGTRGSLAARSLGDIVICPPQAADLREAIVHGALHLVGMDHETDSGEMLALQAEICSW